MQYKKNKMILIVDDSYLIIERLTDMLNELEQVDSISHAFTVTAALEILEQTTPDIILLDINLPDTSGIELLRIVKEKYPSITVAMLTNNANDYYRQLCLKLGADHFVDKSKDFDMIPDIITALEA
ncbi:response regulator transcription factor [Panacibacter ginsenosidivorans]|uniref:Response regulator transcription factor n=2 Tax=Panacibacter ginsenosidivorans TaxID=1813871 RepID=A0A5B8V4I0_9BACT|nr:response regulator transcription factor [Panacibacter ginsenosidivorans]